MPRGPGIRRPAHAPAAGNGDYVLRFNGHDRTLVDDDDEDKLTGDSGRGWFFANLVGHGFKDEVTYQLLSEFADDLG